MMEEHADVYLQRAQAFEAMAADAETEILQRTYTELARSYLTLARFAPNGKPASS